MQTTAKRIGDAQRRIALFAFLAVSGLTYAGVVWKLISISQ